MCSRYLTIMLAGVFWPAIASAHALGARLGDFYEGFLHPPLTLDHVFPLIALGTLAGQQGKKSSRRLVYILPLAMLAGCGLAMRFPGLSWISMINISSFILLGLAVALNAKVPPILLVALTVFFGLSHGYTNGQEITVKTDSLLFLSGVGSAALILAAFVSAAVIRLLQTGKQWQSVAIRVAGSWIAAMGILII